LGANGRVTVGGHRTLDENGDDDDQQHQRDSEGGCPSQHDRSAGGGNWELFDELFDDDFHDHTPQPGGKPDKAGVLELYRRLREAFPDFTPEIHWQKADGDVVMTYKTYHGTHLRNFLGVPGTGRKVSCETVDAMRVVDGRITEHWGVANLYSVMQQLGVLAPLP
jgi:steroid delta-isomerase-like uncharacterized protein